jgi:uncharacterized protein YdeI (YjbR/CyaY-like superfamily)
MQNAMNLKIDDYLTNGCGRCPLGGTPQCKVHRWPEVLLSLRTLVLECGLTEELKWGVPTYTFQGNNVLIVSAFNDFSSLNFFKGVLLSDPKQILIKAGDHSYAGRIVMFTQAQEVAEVADVLKSIIFEAIEVEKSGVAVPPNPNTGAIFPEELVRKLENDPIFKAAFHALTPGRQRGYMIHFAQPKQAATRESRIEKCVDLIMAGKGILDDYRKK